MERKYSVILGNLGNTCDRFCAGYKNNPTSIEMLAEAIKISHVEGIELVGTWDVTPKNASEIKKFSMITRSNVRRLSPISLPTRNSGKGATVQKTYLFVSMLWITHDRCVKLPKPWIVTF